ncbi:urease accessory protein UreD [Planctomyces sp. SH-PL62]|uniref:urease accessory protein UreD n=1 Tax=Planctomyces sp. SH-PL62 TaxID=1636152 RepID=UPI00078EA6E7|nr:urease accessory protein UreD [Planctomyces sp. SH-PL62]AMV40063.1 Urease accessory protein UreD [Planctomyces sp. SH-PL62]
MNVTPTPPELAPYLDEPAQLRSGGFGKNALLRLRFERRGGRSILAFMERRAPLLVQKALYCDEGMPDLPVVFIISNAGGILQGDRYTMDFAVGPGACGHVTTQAATKIHEMDANHALQTQELTLDEGSYLEYIPEAAIPFAHSRFLTRTKVRIAPSATLLYAETLMGGRKYYRDGERYRFDLFSSTVAAERPTGESLFVEKFRVEPARSPVFRPGVMDDFDVFGNVLLLTPPAIADAVAARAVSAWNKAEGWAAGVGRLPNGAGLVYKVVGKETSLVRARIREFWSIVRPEVAGRPVPPEFAWR